MKKVIFISLILLFILIPVSLEVHPDSINIAQLEAFAETAKDSDGITREKCNPLNVYCGVINGLNVFLEWIAWIPIALGSMFVYISGILLNFSILQTVVEYGTHFGNIKGIDDAWKSLRDLANILFIFGLLAIAISTILGLSSYGYKQLLARLIIVALVINFSLFFTKFIIDISNIFALQFYEGIASVEGRGTTGIANTFTHLLGVDKLWDTEGLLRTLNIMNYQEGGGIGYMFLYSIFTFIFLMITSFVFMFASIMLIVRGAGFILLAILSPLAFAALILPKTRGLADQWWQKLWQYAIFAPLLLILFWVTATVAKGTSEVFTKGSALAGGGSMLDILEPGKQLSGIGMVFNFIILITLMMASIIISNKLSLAFGKAAQQFAGKATFGALGSAGRNTFGRGFSRISQSERLKTAASGENTNRITRNLAKLTLGGTRAGAKANYDLRSAPGTAGIAGAFGAELGKGQKGGYEAILKKQKEDAVKFAASLAPSDLAQADRKKPLETAEKKIKAQKEKAEANKSKADDNVKRINREKQTLIRDGGEYSPEMEGLERDLNAAEAEISKAENEVRATKEAEKKIEKAIKDIDDIGKERAVAYADITASERTLDTLFLKVARKNKERAVAIRKGKSKSDKFTSGIKDMLKGDKEFTDSFKPEVEDEK